MSKALPVEHTLEDRRGKSDQAVVDLGLYRSKELHQLRLATVTLYLVFALLSAKSAGHIVSFA